MNIQKKKAAIKKYSEFKNDGSIKERLLSDDKKFSEEEINEIIEGIVLGVKDKPTSPNETLDLSGFDYKNLKGESFKKYVELVGDRSYTEIVDGEEIPVNGELRQDDQYDFQQFKAKPIRVKRYVGVEDSPFNYTGIEIKSDTPLHTSRMSVKTALELNAQILNAHSIAGHGRYYLLKK